MKYLNFSTKGKELQIKDGVFRHTTEAVNYIVDVDQVYLSICGIWRAYSVDQIEDAYNKGKTLLGTKSTITSKLDVEVSTIPTGIVAPSSNPNEPKVIGKNSNKNLNYNIVESEAYNPIEEEATEEEEEAFIPQLEDTPKATPKKRKPRAKNKPKTEE